MTRTNNKVGYTPKSKHTSTIDDRDCSPEFLASAFAVLEGRWKLMILHRLLSAAQPASRFSEIERAIPEASQKMIIQQLRALERDGIIERKVYPQVPPKVEYRLTESGQALRPMLRALLDWANVRDRHVSKPRVG
jgi:DNA-binding HxlR family transcriptional regulator